jgi:hypothetical protein
LSVFVFFLASSRLSGETPQSSFSDYSSTDCGSSAYGSPYIPVDSWIYPAALRLFSLGFADSGYLGMRPWTRASLNHILDETSSKLENAETDGSNPGFAEAQDIYMALRRELKGNAQTNCPQQGVFLESIYSLARGISGTPLRDSFHLGSTIVNDYGRPYANGINSYSGVSGYASHGRFAAYVRTEIQGSPSAAGYSLTQAEALATLDDTAPVDPVTNVPFTSAPPYFPQAIIPLGPISSSSNVRVMEGYLSADVLGHLLSFGKQDEWLGPGQGGAMAYSSNAEGIYAFHINRIEPLRVPLLSTVTGPFRYEFLVGKLRGHTYIPNPDYTGHYPKGYAGPYEPNVISPGDPWVHLEKISFKPTPNLEFGFERTVIWGGKGHEPINLKSFLRSFFSLTNVTDAVKYGNTDPGARFGAFDFTYRLPFLRNWLTLYTDSECHDDVSPPSAPERAAYRPGLYLTHFPGLPKLDLRLEGVSTDPPSTRSVQGSFMYFEYIQNQGYTNQGVLFGDWIGREDKGGQAWTTWHLSPDEWIQGGYRRQKAAKDFIPDSAVKFIPGTTRLVQGGTTLDDVNLQVVKRIKKSLEINGNFAVEHWKAPFYMPGEQTVTTTSIQLTWFPDRKVSF